MRYAACVLKLAPTSIPPHCPTERVMAKEPVAARPRAQQQQSTRSSAQSAHKYRPVIREEARSVAVGVGYRFTPFQIRGAINRFELDALGSVSLQRLDLRAF